MTTKSRPRELHVAEPPAAYRVLPPLTIDCSVLAAALFLEPELEAPAREIMRRSELHAPRLLGYELANVAVMKAASGAEALARAALAALASVPLTLHDVDSEGVFELARRHSLTGYDAAYLWLAGELRTPLATFDGGLAEAARGYLGSEIGGSPSTSAS